MAVFNFSTTKAAANHDLLFDKPSSALSVIINPASKWVALTNATLLLGINYFWTKVTRYSPCIIATVFYILFHLLLIYIIILKNTIFIILYYISLFTFLFYCHKWFLSRWETTLTEWFWCQTTLVKLKWGRYYKYFTNVA